MRGLRALFFCVLVLCGGISPSQATWFLHLKASPYCLSSSQWIQQEAVLTLMPCRGTVDQGFYDDNGHVFPYHSTHLAAAVSTLHDEKQMVLRPYVAQDPAQTIHYGQQQLRVAIAGEQCLVPVRIEVGALIHQVPCSSMAAVWEQLATDFAEREIHSEHQYCLSSGRLLALVPAEKRAVVLQLCHGALGQRWHYRYDAGTLEILLEDRRLCLSVDQQVSDRRAVVLLPCQHLATQKFDFFGQGNIGSRLLPQYHVAAVDDAPEGAVCVRQGPFTDTWQQMRGTPAKGIHMPVFTLRVQ